MKVTRIEPRKGGILAHIEGSAPLAIPDDIVIEFDIAEGRTLTHEEYAAIVYRSHEVFARRYAMHYLARAAHSEHQVRVKLLSKGYQGAVVDETIAHLAEIGFLDDTHYAKLLVDHYREKNRSAREIRFRLNRAHINSDIADDVMCAGASSAERAAVTALVERHYRNYAGKENGMRKFAAFLRRKGFSHDTVMQAIREQKEKEVQ